MRSLPRARRRRRPRESFRNETNRTKLVAGHRSLRSRNPNAPRTSTTTRTIPNFRNLRLINSPWEVSQRQAVGFLTLVAARKWRKGRKRSENGYPETIGEDKDCIKLGWAGFRICPAWHSHPGKGRQ